MKKILFITYYWPPSGKASLHWPVDIMRHLQAYMWQPIILTTKDESFTEKDDSLMHKINSEWLVIKAKAIEPFNIYKKIIGKKNSDKLVASETISKENKTIAHKLSIWLRMNLFIPDARIGWYFPAINKAKKFLIKENLNAIVSIGPPHTTHLVAKKISNILKVPFFPVFIDPWVDISYYRNFKRSKLTLYIDKYLEKSIIEKSKKIIFITESMKEDYVKKYPQIKNKSYVLYWGYDEESFMNLPMNQTKQEISNQERERIIVHAGNIFDYQNPKNLWQEIKRRTDSGEKFKIKFFGTVAPLIKKSIKENGLELFTSYCGFLPYNQMLNELFKADYLLVCATERRHLPGKLFEYLRVGKPIIAFGDDNPEVKKILYQTSSGMIFRYDDYNISEIFDKTFFPKSNIDLIKNYDRKEISKKLNDILC